MRFPKHYDIGTVGVSRDIAGRHEYLAFTRDTVGNEKYSLHIKHIPTNRMLVRLNLLLLSLIWLLLSLLLIAVANLLLSERGRDQKCGQL